MWYMEIQLDKFSGKVVGKKKNSYLALNPL